MPAISRLGSGGYGARRIVFSGFAGKTYDDGSIIEAALRTGLEEDLDRLKKPGIPSNTEEWLRTMIGILCGRRGNAIEVPKFQTLTFSSPPTKAECEALYAYINDNNRALKALILRFDT